MIAKILTGFFPIPLIIVNQDVRPNGASRAVDAHGRSAAVSGKWDRELPARGAREKWTFCQRRILRWLSFLVNGTTRTAD